MPTSLLVEDNKFLQKIHKLSLEEVGYRVDIVGTGREAFARLEAHTYDLVLMDIGLPDTTGIEITKTFRQSHSVSSENTFIIAVTAYVDDDIEKRCFEAGCDLLLSKPITIKELEKHLIALSPVQC